MIFDVFSVGGFSFEIGVVAWGDDWVVDFTGMGVR